MTVGKSLDVFLETSWETGVSAFDTSWFLDLEEDRAVKVGDLFDYACFNS